ncbi:DUF418 domain-containing protein [Streptomyces sp. BI20]|uniref:DUF418 domain-containing protein n=1 Tax=Streptomyces sp. BI20 TaxID=3403460 RepID=UPI003C71D7B0
MGTSRLIGLDAARGLAVLGMFAVHVGPPPRPEGAGWLLVLADGRAPAVFTLIAGLSLSLARAGSGAAPPLRATLIRCAVLGALGLALAALSPGILVILAFYAVYFLAAEPLTRLRTRRLALIAGASVVLGPVLSHLLGPHLGYRTGGRGTTPVPADLTSWHGVAGALRELLLGGAYPLLTYLPYVLVGMVLGRVFALGEPRAPLRLAGFGAAAVLLGHGLSWLALGPLGARAEILRAIAAEHPWALTAADPVAAVLASQYGAVPGTAPEWLLLAGPYSQTPLETLGNIGAGALLVAAATAAARSAPVARLLRPLAAVGAMALSVYVAHALVLALLTHGWSGWDVLLGFSAGALLGCVLWQAACRRSDLRRGPLEWLLRRLTTAAGPRRAPA